MANAGPRCEISRRPTLGGFIGPGHSRLILAEGPVYWQLLSR